MIAISFRKDLILFVFYLSSIYSYSQSINPHHLVNTGINVGHFTMNHENGTSSELYGTWASNASGEWLASWAKGSVTPISPSIDNQPPANDEYVKALQNMPTCINNYYQAKLSIYRVGYFLGRATVETGTSCSKCLQQEMQKAAIELRTISSLIGKSSFADLSNSLNENASNLNLNYNEDMSLQQNEGMFELIKSITETVQNELPDKLFICQTEEPEKTPPTSNEKTSDDKRKKKAFVLKGGINSATLNGDQGTTTASKSGFQVGFDMYRGNPVYYVIGFKFFRNATGEELMIPFTGQVVNTDSYYIQGWVIGIGLGGYLYQNNDITFSGLVKINYMFAQSINGNLISVGNTQVTDGAFSLEIGVGFSYKIAFVELTYEPGLSEVIVSNTEKFKYKMVNLSFGLRF